jgi:hypothetical protein
MVIAWVSRLQVNWTPSCFSSAQVTLQALEISPDINSKMPGIP